MRVEKKEETIVRLEAIRQAHLNPDKEAWRRGNEHESVLPGHEHAISTQKCDGAQSQPTPSLQNVQTIQHNLASVTVAGQTVEIELKPKHLANAKSWYGQLHAGKLHIKVEVFEVLRLE